MRDLNVAKMGFSVLLALGMSLGLAGATQGYFFRKISMLERGFLFVGAFCVIPSQLFINLVGIGLIGITFIMQIMIKPKEVVL